MNNVILIAAPGAGKGVISNYLIDKYNYIHMSAGDLIREKIKNDENLSKMVKEGKLIDDNIVNALIREFVQNNKDKKIIFDGYPRTMSQVPAFESILDEFKINVDKVIHINIDKEIAIKRITGRLMCEKCNHIFNKYIDNVNDTCPDCGGKLYSRSDDNLDTYLNRYDLYLNETYPVFEYFNKKINSFEISNNGTIDEVYSQVDNIMKENIE